MICAPHKRRTNVVTVNMVKPLLKKLIYKSGDLAMIGITHGGRNIIIDPEAKAWDAWLMVHNFVKDEPESIKPFPEFPSIPLQGQLW